MTMQQQASPRAAQAALRVAQATLLALAGAAIQGCAGSEPLGGGKVDRPVMRPVVEAAVLLRESTTDGTRGRTYGLVSFEDGPYGLVITPKLHDMEPGPHAAHVHENASCDPDEAGVPAGAAGGHYDPHGSGAHTGPYGEGHLGDLPNLIVEPNGMATLPVVAPRVTVADLKGRSLMIHAGADRYDAYGEHEHGKGGMRMFCGIIR